MSDPADKQGPAERQMSPRGAGRVRGPDFRSGRAARQGPAHRQAEAQAELDAEMRGRGMAYGMRMAAELVAAVIVGGAHRLGPGLGLGSRPWLFLLFFLLGFAAGVLNVVRAYERMQREFAARTGGRHRARRCPTTRTERGLHVAAPTGGADQGAGMPDPIHQFEIHRIVPINICGWDVSFTNSSLFMLLAVAADRRLLHGGHARRARWCRAGCSRWPRSRYEFVAGMLRESTGQGGHEVLPLRVHALHLHLRLQHAGHDPRRLHGDEPHRRHRRAGRPGVPDRAGRRLRQERPALPQAVRALRRADPTSCRWSR